MFGRPEWFGGLSQYRWKLDDLFRYYINCVVDNVQLFSSRCVWCFSGVVDSQTVQVRLCGVPCNNVIALHAVHSQLACTAGWPRRGVIVL